MSLKGSAQEQDSTIDEILQLTSELQLMREERQESSMHAMREVMAEFMRNNDRSESSRAEGRTAVEGSPRGAGPCLLYTSPSPRDATLSRMPSSA